MSRRFPIRAGLRSLALALCLGTAFTTAAAACDDGSDEAAGREHIELEAADGVTVFGHYFAASRPVPRAVALLFHQAGSNAAEFDPIAPRLVERGFAALALDQRSGGERWGQGNRTVEMLGRGTSFLEALPDLQAAVAWARERFPGIPVLALGSSYSASLVLKLGAEPGAAAPDFLAAFSPGEYFGRPGVVAGWAADVRKPVFITSAGGREAAVAARLSAAVPGKLGEHHVPAASVHGASSLRADRNAAGVEQLWDAFGRFLDDAIPDDRASAAAAAPVTVSELSFDADDGARVFADYYRSSEPARAMPLVLLFHQAGSNAAEYETIAPVLVRAGFDCLAVDSRSGGRRFQRNNRTVIALGRPQAFDLAYSDLLGAANWAAANGYERTIAWGSSYTAALVFRLGAEDESVAAVLSFSPGEHLGEGRPVAAWAARTDVPVFVTSAPGVEVDEAAAIVAGVAPARLTHYRPTRGVHGSSALRADLNAAGRGAYWKALQTFFERWFDTRLTTPSQ